MTMLEAKMKRFDKLCLDYDEQQKLDALKQAECAAIKTRDRQAVGFAWNSTKAIAFGSAFGAVKSVRNAVKYNRANTQVNEIKEQQSTLRQRAKERYERLTGVSVDQTLGWQKGDVCYGE